MSLVLGALGRWRFSDLRNAVSWCSLVLSAGARGVPVVFGFFVCGKVGSVRFVFLLDHLGSTLC